MSANLDGEESCVLVGSSLADLLPEDAKFSAKPKRPEEQIVTDERGRQRFHGAFTGGFSAGYFNTVGTKEGWAPTNFKSSRSDRTGGGGGRVANNRPEDFMDQEDFGEHGIAPRGLKVKSDYKDLVGAAAAASSRTTDTVTRSLGAPKRPQHRVDRALEDLIKPVKNTIGVRMMRQMGWREGQGVGPKIKRKLRKLKSKLKNKPGGKIYGVALPSESDESMGEIDEDEYLVSCYDVNECQFEIKEDLFGLGYKRLDVSNLFGAKNATGVTATTANMESPAASLLFPIIPEGQKKGSKKAIKGHAFGVGDFEDDEDADIYRQESMETYDFELDGKSQQDAKKLLNKVYGFESDMSIIEKFAKSKLKLEPVKVFPPPQIPPDFNFAHKLPADSSSSVETEASERKDSSSSSMNSYLKSISDRAELLGEKPIQPQSVFDLLNKESRDLLQSKIEEQKKTENVKQSEAALREQKEKRYKEFVEYRKRNVADPYSRVNSRDLTEWDRDKEKDEFSRRYDEQIKKIDSAVIKSNRFVSTALLTEQNQEVQKEPAAATSEEQVDSKMVVPTPEVKGAEKDTRPLARTEYVWRPHPVLCKRFNVPNPHPDTKEYGTVKTEPQRRRHVQSEFSILNVLTAQSRFDKAKTKSLFDDLNEDNEAIRQRQIMPNVKTVSLDSKDTTTSSTIEFENKQTANRPDFTSILDENDVEEEGMGEQDDLSNKNEYNVYLKERPSMDIFKAVFEDDDDDDEVQEVENIKSDDDEDTDEEEEVVEMNEDQSKVVPSAVSVIPSSIENINVRQVKELLNQPEHDNLPAVAERVMKQNEPTSSDESSSSSSSSSSVEIIYEEVSIDKKSEHKKKKKKDKKSNKKKKSHRTKKSKKSHKKHKS